MSITIVTRASKAAPLNATEHDANLENLAKAIENTSTGHDHDGSDSKKISAANVVNTPAGNIAAATVQAALNELDAEKLSITTNVAERTFEAENGSEQIQYPIPTSAYMLKAAADGSPAQATNTDTDVADAVTQKHTQNSDTGTSATSFKINTGGNEADIQTTGLTTDRDYTLPDIDTMLAGSALTAQNGMEIIEYTA
jgi:hypothetical protein